MLSSLAQNIKALILCVLVLNPASRGVSMEKKLASIDVVCMHFVVVCSVS